MDRGAWWAAVHGVAEGRTRLSDFTFTFHFQSLEKEMATHSSVLAWRIPETEESGRRPSMGSHRVGHVPPLFQAWAQSTCPELSAQGLVPLRWDGGLPSMGSHRVRHD